MLYDIADSLLDKISLHYLFSVGIFKLTVEIVDYKSYRDVDIHQGYRQTTIDPCEISAIFLQIHKVLQPNERCLKCHRGLF